MDDGVLLIGGAAALWLLSKAHTGKSLVFQPLGASWDGGSLHIDIGAYNPTNDSLQLTSLAGTVFVNGTAAGTLSGFTPALIVPNQQTPIHLKFTPNILGVLSSVFNQVTQGGGVMIGVKGTANVNSILLPVNLTFQAIAA